MGASNVKITTATDLRRNLFRRIRQAVRGVPVIIDSAEGRAVLLSEKAARGLRGRRAGGSAREQKIPGAVVGDLETSDVALRKHLRLPR